ncbi:MAG: triple tyrosine motif-containing protein [Bacteroidota bacterium]|nr:triple tyrosine motif-containing protein [Bacteroidota bacterium]
MKKFNHCLTFLLIVIQGSTFAIQPLVRNYNRKVSMAGTQNWHIIQHKNDWMYFANNMGLLEFDGHRWSTYPIRNYTNVRSLCYDEQADRIYAGAFNEFGYYARNSSGILVYHSLIDKIKPADRNFTEIWNIHKMDNSVFFQGDKEIFLYKGNKMRRFYFKNKIDCSSVVNNSFIISNTQDGPSFLNGNMFMKFPNADLLKNKKICAILPFEKTKILFVTDFYGLFVYNGEKVESFKTDLDSFLSENQVFCATIEGSKLALGTVRDGLVVKDLINNATLFSNTSSGMQNNTILSIAFDHQHNLWLGLDKGIDYVLINSPIYDLFGNSQMFGAGYTSFIQRDVLYLGTNQGLYTTSYPIQNSPNPLSVKLLPKMQGQVWSLTLIGNSIFCGTDHGAFIINGNKVEQIPGILGTWGFRELHHTPNCILGCSYQGFFILKNSNGKWKLSNFLKGFSDTGGMFEEDDDGCIWFSHWMKGVSRLTLNNRLDSVAKVEHFDASMGFPTNRDNTLYRLNNKIVFSTQCGFYTYNHTTKHIERSYELQNIFGVPAHSMKLNETPNGDIWCTSFSFIGAAFKQKNNKYKLDTLSFSSLKNKLISGFEHFNFINRNNIIIGTEDGFSWVDISKLNMEKSIFKISIRGVYLTNESDSVVSGYQPFQKNNQIPEFDHKHNSIRFEYVAPEYRNEGSVTYSYLLENYDSKWSAYTSGNSKEYAKLKKGTYTFRVRAKSLLEANPVETSYEFTILPPWYESKIANLIYLILFSFFIYQLVIFINSRSEKGAREMEAQKELELKEQEKRFEEDAKEKRKEIIELKNQRLHYDLRHKSQELANSTMNLIRKNEILLDISQNLNKISTGINEKSESKTILKEINKMQDEIKHNIENDNNWKRFAENFDLVYENYLMRLSERFPSLTISDKKLCAYLKMDLSSKDIAPLLNMSFRSVEMSRYRLRKKMQLDRDVNLSEFLQNF